MQCDDLTELRDKTIPLKPDRAEIDEFIQMH